MVIFQEEAAAGEKQTNTKKDKALKAREEELRRNLQELGEDVAAITSHTTTPTPPVDPVASVETTAEESSPQQRKKRGAKVEKQLKIKLWGKGLRSKENAEPSQRKDKEDTTEGEDDAASTIALNNKVSTPLPPPPRTVPDDIAHLFAPCTATTVTAITATRPTGRGNKSSKAVFGSEAAAQHLEVINGKRFISIGPGQEAGDDLPAASNKRALPSPGLSSPRPNAKKIKLSMLPIAAPHPAHDLSRVEGYGSFLSDQLNNFISNAYHGLLHVFRYLTVQELMVAAGVCKLWRDLALHHSHVI